jgi:hypothetical protein
MKTMTVHFESGEAPPGAGAVSGDMLPSIELSPTTNDLDEE